MRRWILALGLLLPSLIPAQAVQASIYVVDLSNNLGTVDPSTGAVHVIGTIAGAKMTDIAIDQSGQLWGVTALNLCKIDKSTAVATSVGPLTIDGGMNALAIDPTSGVMYLANSSTTNLYTVNKGSGAATCIGQTGWYSSGDLAFYHNSLYLAGQYQGAASNPDYLVQISLDPVAGVQVGIHGIQAHNVPISHVPPVPDGTPLTNVYGLAVDGNTLYGISGTDVYSLDANSADATWNSSYGGHGLGTGNGASDFTNPEPATAVIWSLLAALGIGFGWWRKRKAA